MTRQLERVGLTGGKSATDFANDFAASTAHRSPYVLAIVHGATVNGSARPYAMTVTGGHRTASSQFRPFAGRTQCHVPNEYGELALIGEVKRSDRDRRPDG